MVLLLRLGIATVCGPMSLRIWRSITRRITYSLRSNASGGVPEPLPTKN